MRRTARRLIGSAGLVLGMLCGWGAQGAQAQETNLFVATTGSNAPGNPGTDPDTPLLTIDRAVVLAQAAGGQVRITVSPGTYQVAPATQFLDLPPATILESTEGPFWTTIRGNTNREVVRLNPGGLGGRSEVRGFTITLGQKGIVALAGGQSSQDGAYMIENCIIQANNNGTTWDSKPELDPFYSFFNSDVGVGGELAGTINVGVLALKDGISSVQMELTIRNNHIFGNGSTAGGTSSNGIGVWYDVERNGALPASGQNPVRIESNLIYDHEHAVYCTSDTSFNFNAGSAPLIANNVCAQSEQAVMLHKRKDRIGSGVAQLLPVIVHNTIVDSQPASTGPGVHMAAVKLWGEVRITELANNLFVCKDRTPWGPWGADIDIGDWSLYSWPPSTTNLGLNGNNNGWNNGIGAFIQPQNFRRTALAGPRVETGGPPVVYRWPAQSPIDYGADYRLVGYDVNSILQNTTLIDTANVLARVNSGQVRVDLNGDPRLIQYKTTGPYRSDYGADEKEFVRLAHGGSEQSVHLLYRNASTRPGGDTSVLQWIPLEQGHPYFEQPQTNMQAGMLLDFPGGFVPTIPGFNMQAAITVSLATAGSLAMQYDGFVWLSILNPPSWSPGLVGLEVRFTAWTHDTLRGITRGTNELFVRWHRN